LERYVSIAAVTISINGSAVVVAGVLVLVWIESRLVV
jgi:hypothetical protein